MELTYAELSTAGPVRTKNEDCVGTWQPETLDEKRARDLLRGETTEQSQGQPHLCLGGERGVAAGEDETEAIVVNFFIANFLIPGGGVGDARFDMGDEITLCSIEARAPADDVDGLEAGR